MIIYTLQGFFCSDWLINFVNSFITHVLELVQIGQLFYCARCLHSLFNALIALMNILDLNSELS